MRSMNRKDVTKIMFQSNISYSAITTEEVELFNSTMRDLAVDPRSVKLLIEKRLETGRQHTGKGFRIAPETTELFKRAMDRARSQGRRVIEASDIFYVLLE